MINSDCSCYQRIQQDHAESHQRMGCASSKILTRSGSIQDELRRRLPPERSKELKELKASKNGRDRQVIAILYSASTVAKTAKSVPLLQESETKSTAAAAEHTDTKTVDANPPVELAEVETINAWEMLDGLEDDKEEAAEGSNQHRSAASSDTGTPKGIGSKLVDERFVMRTVEDYEAMVAANELVAATSKDQEVQVSEESDSSTRERSASTATLKVDQREKNSTVAKASRRKAMAKELSAIKIPSFDFSMRSGSLRDWLLGGGQVTSPGSYVTPKFGNSDKEEPAGGLDHAIFDPEMVGHFERAMEELTVDEESILEQILESLKEGHEDDASRMEMPLSHGASTEQNL